MTDEELQAIALQLLQGHDWQIVKALRATRRAVWLALLSHFKWNVYAAAKAAGIRRTEVYQYIKSYGLVRPADCPPRHAGSAALKAFAARVLQ